MNKSTINDHVLLKSHDANYDDFSILLNESSDFKLLLKESLSIKKDETGHNRNVCSYA